MQQIELTQKEFENINVKSAKEMLKILKHKYQKEYQESIKGLIGYCEDMDVLEGQEPDHYSVSDIYMIFDETQILEYLDGVIDEDILINYFVTDSIGTDNGIWHMIVENGYVLSP